MATPEPGQSPGEHAPSDSGASRGYEAALKALSTLITRRKRADGSNWGDAFSLMQDYIKILELDAPLDRLSVIHVAGTKGKGSTCAFAESILRANGHTTGLFTSPHLVDIRERFRFNGREVSEEIFLQHFWWCFDRLMAGTSEEVPMPAYFRFLTLLALRLFTAEKVDVAILEVGIGGRYDATNVIKAPTVCGVASLGFDHMELLGHTLGAIAGEKAGIFKAGVPAITSPQPEEGMAVLRKRAEQLQIPLEEAASLEPSLPGVALGLAGEHQKVNAALAVALCRKWAERTEQATEVASVNEALKAGRLPESYIRGLEDARWPGRAQILRDPAVEINGDDATSASPEEQANGRLSFYLDGAHTPESMEVCAQWFAQAAKDDMSGQDETNFRQVLLFNCMPERDPRDLLPPLVSMLSKHGVTLHRTVVVPGYSSYTSVGPYKSPASGPPAGPDLSWQRKIQLSWEALQKKDQDSQWSTPNHSFIGSLKNLNFQTGRGEDGSPGVSSSPHAPIASAIAPPRDFVTSSAKSMAISSSAVGTTEPQGECFLGPTSVVMPSLPAALEFLRRSVREHPPLRLQVLVTGSLHLVGDILKLVKYKA